jgi:hypothetical protein
MPTAPGSEMLDAKLFVTRTAEPWRNLFERFWDGAEWLWLDHGRPAGVPVTGIPGAAMLNSKLFVTVDDGRLFERVWTGAAWAWNDHGRPENVRIIHGPSAAMLNTKLFVVVEDGRLFERHWNGAAWAWMDHGRPQNGRIVHAPGAAMLNSKLFVVIEDGRLFERVWTGTAWAWNDHGRPENKKIVQAPGAAMMDSKLFVTIEDGRVFERTWTGAAWVWSDHGRPAGTNITSAPGAAMMNQKFFATGADGRLVERWWNGTAWAWVDHGRPPGTRVTTAPGAAMANSKLFVGTANDHLFERFWNGTAWTWVDHGTLLHDTRATLLDNTTLRPRRVTLAVIGDGFTEADLQSYRDYVDRELMNGVFARDLFSTLRTSFNVIRIDLVSVESGVSTRTFDEAGTPNDGSDDTVVSETFRFTRLGYRYSGSWAHCWMDETPVTVPAVTRALARFAPGADNVIIVLNNGGWGGCARGNRLAVTRGVGWDTLYHELGHAVGGLGDEYFRSGRTFPGGVPPPNCSATSNRTSLPWADLVDPATPLPTNSVPAGGNSNTTVGAYPGCGTFDTGLFRPVDDCRMRSNSPPYCPVCERILRGILPIP